MTRVELTPYVNLLDTDALRNRYERQKWYDTNPEYDAEDETIMIKVSDTDPYNPLPDHLKSDK